MNKINLLLQFLFSSACLKAMLARHQWQVGTKLERRFCKKQQTLMLTPVIELTVYFGFADLMSTTVALILGRGSYCILQVPKIKSIYPAASCFRFFTVTSPFEATLYSKYRLPLR